MRLTNYWWLLVWAFVGGGILSEIFPKQKEIVGERKKVRWSVGAAIAFMLPYIIWTGFRGDNFGDTGAYRSTFYQTPWGINDLRAYLDTLSKDKGFSVFTALLRSVLQDSDSMYFLIIGAFQLIILALVLRRYSENYWLSVFIFIASTEYMSWCHNGIRQFIAVMIIFAGTRFLLKRQYIPLILLILLASTFHASALLMLPIIFIVQGKAWNLKTIVCIIASIVILVYINQFTGILDEALSDTQYASVVDDWTEWQDDGTNPIRVLIYSIPMLLSIVGLPQIRSENDNFVNVMTNFSILTTGIAIISMVTSGIFIGRLIIYPAIYSTFLLLPWEIENLFEDRSASLVKTSAIAGYSLFFFYQMHMVWGIL